MNASTEPRDHFITLLKKFHTAMLVSHSLEEGFHARPMAVAKVEDDGHLWFFTGAASTKVQEIAADSHVFLTAQDGDNAFLTLSGRATLLADRALIDRLWSEPFRVWFPDGKDDRNLQLISVRPDSGEFWDTTGTNRIKYLWEAAKAYATGTTPKIDEGEQHGAVRL